MANAKENSFLIAFRLHRSGIRFLRAGLYCDAIHTLIEGLEVLQFSMIKEDSYNMVAVKYARWKQMEGSILNQKMEINQKPMDHTCYTNEEWMTPILKPCCTRCRGSLVGAMLYNMALAYHLLAMTFQQDSPLLYSYLNQASSLYSAAEGVLQKYNVPTPERLGANEQHIHWLICTRAVPDSSLLSFQESIAFSSPPPSSSSHSSHSSTSNFGSMMDKEPNLEATLCSITNNATNNSMEADFGSTSMR